MTYWLIGLGLLFLLISGLWLIVPALYGLPWVPTREKRIRKALHVRLESKPMAPETLPRYDLKTKRIIDNRPKELRRALDR